MLLRTKECSFAVISTLPHCLRLHFNVNQLAKKTPTQCTHTHPLPHIAFKRDFKFPQQANTHTHTTYGVKSVGGGKSTPKYILNG